MQEITINAQRRQEHGKALVKKLRRQGRIPAVIYGPGKDTISLTLDAKELAPIFKEGSGENFIIALRLDDGTTKRAIIRQTQTEPIRNRLLHLDFQEISLEEKIKVRVPVETIGTPEGVKNQGGILEHILDQVEISCLPGDIPDKIVVDISHLKVGQSLHIGDIKLDKAKILNNSSQVVVTVIAPIVETATPEAEAAAEPKEPEVISKGKKEEEPEA